MHITTKIERSTSPRTRQAQVSQIESSHKQHRSYHRAQ